MLEFLSHVPLYILIGPIVLSVLLLLVHFLLRDEETFVKSCKICRIYSIFIEHTGSPPTDEEYIAFSKLSERELNKIARTFKK